MKIKIDKKQQDTRHIHVDLFMGEAEPLPRVGEFIFKREEYDAFMKILDKGSKAAGIQNITGGVNGYLKID